MRLLADGIAPAYDELVRRYRRPLIAYAGSIVGGEAEDVVQEALTRAQASLQANPEIDPQRWLFRVVRNTALNHARDNSKHDHEELPDQLDGVPQPDEVLERRAALGALVAALRDLPEEQRAAIVKRELEGRSHDEIASSLAVSPGAVRQLIYRARRTLREGLGSLLPLPVVRQLAMARGQVEASGAAAGLGAGAAAAGGGGGLKVAAAVIVAGGSLIVGTSAQHDGSPAAPGSAEASPRHESAGPGSHGDGGGETTGGAGPSRPGDGDGPGAPDTGGGEGGDSEGDHDADGGGETGGGHEDEGGGEGEGEGGGEHEGEGSGGDEPPAEEDPPDGGKDGGGEADGGGETEGGGDKEEGGDAPGPPD